MEKNKNILFASDLSKEMEIAFKQAAITAISQKMNIIVVHVMEESSRSEKRIKTAFGKQIFKDLKTGQREGARNILSGKKVDALKIRRAIADFFQDDTKGTSENITDLISKIIVTDSQSIANAIVTTAVEEDCQMVVMGCKQHGLLAEAMGDHVVRKVLKRSSVPVLVVPLPN